MDDLKKHRESTKDFQRSKYAVSAARFRKMTHSSNNPYNDVFNTNFRESSIANFALNCATYTSSQDFLNGLYIIWLDAILTRLTVQPPRLPKCMQKHSVSCDYTHTFHHLPSSYGSVGWMDGLILLNSETDQCGWYCQREKSNKTGDWLIREPFKFLASMSGSHFLTWPICLQFLLLCAWRRYKTRQANSDISILGTSVCVRINFSKWLLAKTALAAGFDPSIRSIQW